MAAALVLGSVNPPQCNRGLASTALLHGLKLRENQNWNSPVHTSASPRLSFTPHTPKCICQSSPHSSEHHSLPSLLLCPTPCPQGSSSLFKPCAFPSDPHRSLQPGRYHTSKNKNKSLILFYWWKSDLASSQWDKKGTIAHHATKATYPPTTQRPSEPVKSVCQMTLKKHFKDYQFIKRQKPSKILTSEELPLFFKQ